MNTMLCKKILCVPLILSFLAAGVLLVILVIHRFNVCFYRLAEYDILNNDTFVLLEGNVASITRYQIYGFVRDCFTLVTATQQVKHEHKNLASISRAVFTHVFYFK